VLSSHFCPGFAPQVGQWIPNTRLAFLFMTPDYAYLKRDMLFTLAHLKISTLQRSIAGQIGTRTMVDPIPFFAALSGVLLLTLIWKRFKQS
jgi:hypothetical protein